MLCSKPILAIFDRNLPTYIYTDASIAKPVAYFSKKFNGTQKEKKEIYLECLAIKEAVKYWQHWLIGREFIIFIDHKSLENMNSLPIKRCCQYFTASFIARYSK